MVRAALVTAVSLALTGAVVAHAYFLKHQFYPTVVYLTKSSPSMAVSRRWFIQYQMLVERQVHVVKSDLYTFSLAGFIHSGFRVGFPFGEINAEGLFRAIKSC